MEMYSTSHQIFFVLVITGTVTAQLQNVVKSTPHTSKHEVSTPNHTEASNIHLNDEDMQLLSSYLAGGSLPENFQLASVHKEENHTPTNQEIQHFIKTNGNNGENMNGAQQVYIIHQPGQGQSELELQTSGKQLFHGNDGQNLILSNSGQRGQESSNGLQLSGLSGQSPEQNLLLSSQNVILSEQKIPSQQIGQLGLMQTPIVTTLQNQINSAPGNPNEVQFGVSNGKTQPSRFSASFPSESQQPLRQPAQRAQDEDIEAQQHLMGGKGWYPGQQNQNNGRFPQQYNYYPYTNYQQQYPMYGPGGFPHGLPPPIVPHPVYYVHPPIYLPGSPIFMGHQTPHYFMKGPKKVRPHHKPKLLSALYNAFKGDRNSEMNHRPTQNIKINAGRPEQYPITQGNLETPSVNNNNMAVTSNNPNSNMKLSGIKEPSVLQSQGTVQNLEKQRVVASTQSTQIQNENKQVTESINQKGNINDQSAVQKSKSEMLNLNLGEGRPPIGAAGQLQLGNVHTGDNVESVVLKTPLSSTQTNLSQANERNGELSTSNGLNSNTDGVSTLTGNLANKVNMLAVPNTNMKETSEGVGITNGGKLNIASNAVGNLQTIHIFKQSPGGLTYNGNMGRKNGTLIMSLNGQKQNGGNDVQNNRGNSIRIITMPQKSSIQTIKLISQPSGSGGQGITNINSQNIGKGNIGINQKTTATLNYQGDGDVNQRNIEAKQATLSGNNANIVINGVKIPSQTIQSKGNARITSDGVTYINMIQSKETESSGEMKYTKINNQDDVKGAKNDIQSTVNKFQTIQPASKIKQIKFHPNSFLITPIKHNLQTTHILQDDD